MFVIILEFCAQVLYEKVVKVMNMLECINNE
jgi:hypothetical protein